MAEVINTPPPSLLRKLDEIDRRYDELESQLSDPAVLSNSQRIVAISKEKGQLEGIVGRFREYRQATAQVRELRELIANKSDREMADLAASELPGAEQKAGEIMEALKDEFVAAEDNAVDMFFLEIRAGTGGEEAALFARDLYEMYRRYAEQHRWRFVVSDFSVSERGGFKECIISMQGAGAYRHLRFEGGGHRVQRVPETEAQGRIHTSAATVAVMPELPDVKIEINMKDITENGCRGGGPGGQNVNKVETGWLIKHAPSGLIFKMTEHKSQAQNKERAWALLRSTLHAAEVAKQHAASTSARKAMMGSGDRSQRIRTYNFPQNRCTDHRLGGEGGGEKNFNLDQIMAGQMDPLIKALLDLDKQERLEALEAADARDSSRVAMLAPLVSGGLGAIGRARAFTHGKKSHAASSLVPIMISMKRNFQGEPMDKWMNVAGELRAARRAREEFFLRAFVDQSIIGPLLLDRIAADLGGFSDLQMSTVMPSLQSMRRMADER